MTAVDVTAVPRSPFRGLSPFGDSELDALLFFGREREAEVIAANLMAANLTVLYGPSGVGKTSVVRAGVAHRLRAIARDNLRAYGEPGLAVAVVDSWSGDAYDAVRRATDAAVAEALGEDVQVEAESLPEHLTELGRLVGGEIYVVLDQFEEFFLYHGEEEGVGTLADELPELVTRADVPVGVLIALREDALAQLDAFKARIPGLFANSLRLDRLDRRAARAAVLGPIDAYNALAREDEQVEIEPGLVEAVLDQVTAGRIEHGRRGRGIAGSTRARRRVEAPYLQLVLQRVWDAEREAGSLTLRLSTLQTMGGAERIVERHLEGALARLSADQRDAAAAAFHHLVTPSGTKIAHAAPDLARYANVPDATLRPALAALAADRVIRPLGGDAGEPRFEIFHDVLSDAVLAWREKHETERALAQERAAARRRHRRLVAVLGAAFVALAFVCAIALYALTQRSEAKEQAEAAQVQRAAAVREAERAEDEKARAETEKSRAEDAQAEAERSAETADEERGKAEKQEALAVSAKADAERAQGEAEQRRDEATQQKAVAEDATAEAKRQEEIAEGERREAEAAAEVAERQRKRANTNAAKAGRARQASERSEARAKDARADAVQQARRSHGKELAARALSLVPLNPERAVRRALEAAYYEPSVATEGILRSALQAFRLLAVLPGGGGAVRGLAMSVDGRLLAIGADGGGARLFDTGSGRRLRVFGARTDVASVALSPDNRLLATAGADESARIYSLETGTLLHTLAHGARVRTVEFSHDGTRLVTAAADTARIWDPATGINLRTLAHGVPPKSAEFSPSDRLVLTVGTGPTAPALVFDAVSGDRIVRLALANEVTDAEFSPNGAFVATSGRRNVALWETAGWNRRPLLEGHTTPIRAVKFSPDGARVASASNDGTARLWRTDTGALLDVLTGHDAPLTTLSFSPTGDTIATASTDRRARLSLGLPGQPNLVFAGHRDTVGGVAFVPREAKLITISNDGDARIWSTKTDEELRLIGRHNGELCRVAYSPDGSWILSAGADGTAQLRTPAGRLVRSFEHGTGRVCASFSTTGALVLTAGVDGNARLWQTDNGRPAALFEHGSPIRSATLSPDGTRVATGGDDGRLRLWDVRGKRQIAERVHGGPVAVTAFSRDGKTVATGADDSAVRLFRAGDGRLVRTLRGHTDTIASLDFSPDGMHLASAGAGTDFTARIWDVTDGSAVVLESHEAALTTVRYRPDGRMLLTAGVDGDLRTWLPSGGVPRSVVRGHVATISDAVFSPDGRWIATAGPQAAGLWWANTGARLTYLRGHPSAVRSVAFAPEDEQIVTGGADGTVRSFDCALCGGLTKLRAVGKARLDALRRANAAAAGGP